MAHLIDKDALVAEIKKLMYNLCPDFYEYNYDAAKIELLEKIENFINTLEVKEVDLEKEMDKEWNKCEPIDEGMGLEIASIEHEQFDNIAKHFFELGLKVAQKGE